MKLTQEDLITLAVKIVNQEGGVIIIDNDIEVRYTAPTTSINRM